jgi:hypothetical protein
MEIIIALEKNKMFTNLKRRKIMKKTLGIVLAMVFLFCGCVFVSPEAKELIAETAGRQVGYELAKTNSDIAQDVLDLSQAIIKEENPKIVFESMDKITVLLVSTKIEDPLVIAAVESFLKVVPAKAEVVIIKAAASGLIKGIELFKQNK